MSCSLKPKPRWTLLSASRLITSNPPAGATSVCYVIWGLVHGYKFRQKPKLLFLQKDSGGRAGTVAHGCVARDFLLCSQFAKPILLRLHVKLPDCSVCVARTDIGRWLESVAW